MQRLRLFGALVLMIAPTGCSKRPPESIQVRGMKINGYEFDYELRAPSRIQTDARDVHLGTGKHQIEVVDGTLLFDGKSYGAVKPNDHIVVEGETVRVNGEVRKKPD